MRKKRCKVLFVLRWPKSISEKCLLLPAATNRALKREAFSAMRPRAVGATRVTVQWGSPRCPGVTTAQVTQCPFTKNPPFTQTKWIKGHFMQPQNTAEVAHRTPNSTPSPAQQRLLSHTRDTFSSESQCPAQALLSPSLSLYWNQSTQLETWKDIKCTELCQEPSQKWQLLRQSDSSLKSLSGNVGLDEIPRQIQGVPSGSHVAHHQPGCEVLKTYKLWAERSPNQPTASFRSPADPKKEFWFQYTFRCPSTQSAFSKNVTPALCNTAERASKRKHSRKPGYIVTLNHSALTSPELALF